MCFGLFLLVAVLLLRGSRGSRVCPVGFWFKMGLDFLVISSFSGTQLRDMWVLRMVEGSRKSQEEEDCESGQSESIIVLNKAMKRKVFYISLF